MKKYFVTGIGTEIGKTLTSSILVEALEADYWKPIQAGELENSDTLKVKALISNNKSQFHQESYRLKAAMSPHAAAQRENIEIQTANCTLPQTQNRLIIEGAGGLFVPIKKDFFMIDFIKELRVKTFLITSSKLGCINDTLLSIEALKNKQINFDFFQITAECH